MKDAYDLSMSAGDQSVVDAYDAYVANLLSYGPDFAPIFRAAEEAADDAFLNAHAAMVHMSLEAREGYEAAEPYLDRVRAGYKSANPREQMFCDGALYTAEKAPRQALASFKSLVDTFPSDICTAKWGQTQAFNLGDAESLLEIGQKTSEALNGVPYVKGMLAFGCEQMNQIEQAELAAREALHLQGDDAWAHHALAHVFETEGRLEEGVALLSDWADSWNDKGVFIREHNWWHLALYQLDLDRSDQALRIFDDHLFGEWPGFGQEQIGATSMLWRMELRGIDVGGRWAKVSGEVAKRGFEHIQPFHDLHYTYALARQGDGNLIAEFFASLTRHSASIRGDMKEVWAEVCLPAAQGVAAHACGDFQLAFERLQSVLAHLPLIGGSIAQRDLFHQTYLDAAIKCGERSAVTPILEARVKARPNDLFALSRL